MKIWLGGSLKKWDELRANLFSIRDFLKNHKIEVLNEWIEEADKTYKTPVDKKIENYGLVMDSIDAADIVLIEHTVPNFHSSMQIAYAYLKKKKMTVLRQADLAKDFDDSLLDSLTDTDYYNVKTYVKSSLKNIITEIINAYNLESGNHRYNIVLNKKQKYYLDWAASKYKKSRSEIVRKLVEYGITNDDLYKKFMNTEF